MRTAEERAEAVNTFSIYVGQLVEYFAQRVPLDRRATFQLTLLDCTLQDLLDVIDELREAKLARAKLELTR